MSAMLDHACPCHAKALKKGSGTISGAYLVLDKKDVRIWLADREMADQSKRLVRE